MNAASSQLDRHSFKPSGRILAITMALAMFTSADLLFAGDYWLLSVGINKYSSGVSPLNACVNDANDMIDALARDTSRWSLSRMFYLADYDATKNNIRYGLYYLASVAQPGDVVVYFQSSHGGQVAEGSKATYLCTTDGKYHDTEVGADLAAWFSDDVKIVFIVDACHSGGLMKSEGGASRANRDWSFGENAMSAFEQARGLTDTAKAKASGRSISFMTAADFNELSSEAGRNGFYAGSLVHALKNAAADSSDDGLLSFLEMHRWASNRASSLNPNQNAQLSNESLVAGTIVSIRGSGSEPPPEPPCDGGICCDMRGGTPLLMAMGFAGLVGDQRRRRNKR